jgi:hypothetical protein
MQNNMGLLGFDHGSKSVLGPLTALGSQQASFFVRGCRLGCEGCALMAARGGKKPKKSDTFRHSWDRGGWVVSLTDPHCYSVGFPVWEMHENKPNHIGPREGRTAGSNTHNTQACVMCTAR